MRGAVRRKTRYYDDTYVQQTMRNARVRSKRQSVRRSVGGSVR